MSFGPVIAPVDVGYASDTDLDEERSKAEEDDISAQILHE